MDTLYSIFGISTPAAVTAAPVMSEDNSGIFVWIFLGFCALIVVAQVVPAILQAAGLIKGVASASKEQTATANAKK